jgi:putative FmdB family regulatory protein
MPIYEYICQDCGTRVEALRPMKDADAPIQCTTCRGDHTTRQLSRIFATGASNEAATASVSGGCGGCSGGSCANCHH